jgi:NAD-dependent dihydropyrimidine dehydrogenase PreA subunit
MCHGAGQVKRVLLVIFSGTHNTRLVAEMIGKNFRENNIPADIRDITEPRARNGGQFFAGEDEYDVIGLGYPVYAFNTPRMFLRYVKNLGLRGKSVFIFKTSGEPMGFNRASSFELLKALKNNRILGEYHFLMPYNIIFRFPGDLVRQMYYYALKHSKIVATDIMNNRVSRIKAPLFFRLVARVFRIQRLGAVLNGRLYRVREDRCNFCLRCVRDCPAGNIRVNSAGGRGKKFRFGFSCQMCMRCSFYCPADAITIGLLNAWKVNGPYRFGYTEQDENPDWRFINKRTKGFYRVYVPYFEALDRLFDAECT